MNICLENRADDTKTSRIVLHIHHEMGLHIEYCKGFGMSKQEIEASEESQGKRTCQSIADETNKIQSLYSIHQVEPYWFSVWKAADKKDMFLTLDSQRTGSHFRLLWRHALLDTEKLQRGFMLTQTLRKRETSTGNGFAIT